MKPFPNNPVPGSAISAAHMSRLADAARDSHIASAPGMLLSGVPGASALSVPDAFEQGEWFNPYPYGPAWLFGVAFRPPLYSGSGPRVRVFPGVLRRQGKNIATQTTDLVVTETYRWIVASVSASNLATVWMWDEATDYTSANFGLSTIHDKNGNVVVPICCCSWQSHGDPAVESADILRWHANAIMLPVT